MLQTGHLEADKSLTEDMLKQMFEKKIGSTNFNEAKRDVEHLLKNPSSLEVWSNKFFRAICEKIKTK